MRHKGMRSLLILLVITLALCSLTGLFAPFFWLLDLFNHFRPQAIVASSIVMILAIFYDKRIVYAAMAVALLNSGLVAKRLYQTAGIPAMAENTASTAVPDTISVVLSNVLTHNREYGAVLAMMAREKPQVAIFIEPDERWVTALEPLKKDYPFTLKHTRDDNFGIAVYSQLPFEHEITHVGNLQLPLAVLNFGRFYVVTGHPIPPLNNFSMAENRHYLEMMAHVASSHDAPVILAGDLNTTLWSDALAPLVEAHLKRINQAGFAYTWPTAFAPFALHIDHFFGKNIAAADFRVLEYVGSDHYPVRADFILANPQKK